MICEDTGVDDKDAVLIEHIMRTEIFRSTLDWQSREQLRSAARNAQSRLAEDRSLYEEYFRSARDFYQQHEK